MNYKRIYFNLIKTRKNFIPLEEKHNYEKHHIIPRSFGGKNNKNNLVYLTTREHYIAHLLLVKITKKQIEKIKNSNIKEKRYKSMLLALRMMQYGTKNRKNKREDVVLNSTIFSILRDKMREAQRKYSKNDVETMFDFYIKHNCSYSDENYKKFQNYFDYPFDKKQLLKLFVRNNLFIKNKFDFFNNKYIEYKLNMFFDKVKKENSLNCKKFDKAKAMFEFYILNNCAIDETKYKKLQNKFNYSSDKKQLHKIFMRNNLSIKEFNIFLLDLANC